MVTGPEEKNTAGQSAPTIAQGADRLGLLAAFLSFVMWGVLPVFWKALDTVPSLEVLCHRVVWSFLILCPFVLFTGRLSGLSHILRTRRNLLGLVASGFILTSNWFLYIWAVTSNMILETSLGYYINPLVNILFGLIFFREKISRWGWTAIGIAVLGVSWQVVGLGHFPFVPLGLAFSFGIYGLLRKLLQVQALPGLFVETFVVLPLALGYLLWQGAHGESVLFRGDWSIDALLVGAGLVTTAPLLLFAYGARRIRMTSLGILQYASPTCTFLLGVFVYHEAISAGGLFTFACIWAALAIYTWDSIKNRNW
jgi:chloramphenicol-sensitive protein RarD